METFYDGDLKDIWDSDLDPTESLKISTDTDMHDWFLERDIKDPAVILNDKLISDALLNGTFPIKSEHSYSLNSDGDSLLGSPRSLQTKMDDMEEECYPAISLKTATSNLTDSTTIDPKSLTISRHGPLSFPSVSLTNFSSNGGNVGNLQNTLLSAATAVTSAGTLNNESGLNHSSASSSYVYKNITSAPMTFNLHTSETSSNTNANNSITSAATTITLSKHLPQVQQSQQYLPHKLSENDCCSPTSSTRESSISPDICSDIEIDESCVKDEPLSPDSSCPPSPTFQGATTTNCSGALSFNMASFANSDLVFKNKNGCLQLTSATQSLLKSQQIILGTGANSPNIIIPKFNIKSETKLGGSALASGLNNSNAHKSSNSGAYGLPLTPPSSIPSDESEGNLTPEHLLSPLSPTSATANLSAANNNGAMALTAIVGGRHAQAHTSITSNGNCLNNGRNINSGTTRQPIHTPLISSQPKGSTGTLILTEEEKRTLLAEGYPIPQKLPLTKAEEKSLKKIRRKIKNKISAQESRRKKKEYMDQLERRVEILVNENSDYRKRVESLEGSNASLLSQLHKLQALVSKQNAKKT